MSSPQTKQPAWWQPFVAGNMGGIFGLTFAYPLDTVKVRFQTRPKGTYSGIWNCMTTMARTEGALSLYRGLLSPVMGYGLIKAMAFGTYARFKNMIALYTGSDPKRELASWELGIAAVGAGFVQSFVRAPVEQIKVIMQARNKPGSTLPPYSGSIDCLRQVIRTEGVKVGLYRGMNATVLREMPQYGIYYPTYDLLCRMAKDPKTGEVSKLNSFLAGGAAGVFQWAPTYSFDVVKSRIQAAEPGTYSGLWDCTKKLYATEGIGAFGRGFAACMLRAFPLHGAVFVGYEITMGLFAKMN